MPGITDAGHPSDRPHTARGRILFDPTSCRRCQLCEVSCAIYRFRQALPGLASIRIAVAESAGVDPSETAVCQQCESAPCLLACPVDAISRHARTRAIIVDERRCIGCMSCLRACPWHIPRKHPDRPLAIICDLCSTRTRGPVCVEVCPVSGQALDYRPVSAPAGTAPTDGREDE